MKYLFTMISFILLTACVPDVTDDVLQLETHTITINVLGLEDNDADSAFEHQLSLVSDNGSVYDTDYLITGDGSVELDYVSDQLFSLSVQRNNKAGNDYSLTHYCKLDHDDLIIDRGFYDIPAGTNDTTFELDCYRSDRTFFITNTVYSLDGIRTIAQTEGYPTVDAGMFDAVCKFEAELGGLNTENGYIAWVSDSASNAIDRMNTPGLLDYFDYRSVLGDRVRRKWNLTDELANYTENTGFNTDQYGADLGVTANTWSATDRLGHGVVAAAELNVNSYCENWRYVDAGTGLTSIVDGGTVDGAEDAWTTGSTLDCNEAYRIACLENTFSR